MLAGCCCQDCDMLLVLVLSHTSLGRLDMRGRLTVSSCLLAQNIPQQAGFLSQSPDSANFLPGSDLCVQDDAVQKAVS